MTKRPNSGDRQWFATNRATRSYTVETEAGQKYGRNRRHIMKYPEPQVPVQQPQEPSAADQHQSEAEDSAEHHIQTQVIEPTPTVTRSGRTIKQPERYGY